MSAETSSYRRTDDDEPMTAAELRVVREYLGLTKRWLAEHLAVQERTIDRWEAGSSPVPDGVRTEIERMESVTADHVAAAVAACNDARDPALVTYRTDAEYRRHHPEVRWPASWHRAVCARVAQDVPGLVIDYWAGGSAVDPDEIDPDQLRGVVARQLGYWPPDSPDAPTTNDPGPR